MRSEPMRAQIQCNKLSARLMIPTPKTTVAIKPCVALVKPTPTVGPINLERRSVSGLALQPDMAAVMARDAVNGGETEPAAFAGTFRGEERLEDMSLKLLG